MAQLWYLVSLVVAFQPDGDRPPGTHTYHTTTTTAWICLHVCPISSCRGFLALSSWFRRHHPSCPGLHTMSSITTDSQLRPLSNADYPNSLFNRDTILRLPFLPHHLPMYGEDCSRPERRWQGRLPRSGGWAIIVPFSWGYSLGSTLWRVIHGEWSLESTLQGSLFNEYIWE